MKAAVAVFAVAAAFAWLAARGTVSISAHSPSQPTIVLRAGKDAAAGSAPTRGEGIAVRRRVERVRIDRYSGGGHP